MKKIFFILFSIVICSCQAQKKNSIFQNNLNSQRTAFIDNDKINYLIAIMSCDTCVPISIIGYRVVINLSQEEEDIVKKIDYQDWMSLLSNEQSDWAANLILYYIFDRDSKLLSRVKSRKEWKKYKKKEDLEFWKLHLKKD